jgi:hypothetical protein
MSSGFEKPDLDSFFDISPGVGVLAQIFKADANGDIEMDQGTPPAPVFWREVNAIFFSDTQEISLYPESNAEASDPSIVVKQTDVAGVKRGYRVVFPNVEPHEEGYGQTFEVTPRNAGESVQTMRLHLKQL